MVEARRTLVKSGPELWAELSDPTALGRHLEPFGAVRLVHADAETSVAWEGERARGEVLLEPSGFGTRVTLRAQPTGSPGAPAPVPAADASESAPDAASRPGVWARLFRRRPASMREAPAPSDVAPAPPVAPTPALESPPAAAMADEEALRILTDVLEMLGRAHHRPFSRA